MKLKVEYETKGVIMRSYVMYKGKKYYLSLLQQDYGDFIVKTTICEPIDTYIVIEEK